jgi:putative ABC transport system permease protein
MDSVLQDLRYAVRTLARSPGFTAIAVLTMAIGTGANATVFGFVNALLLRPAPHVVNPRTLVAIFTSDFSSGPYGDSSYPDFVSLQTETTAFAQMAAERDAGTTAVMVAEAAERVRTSAVSGGYFDLLGLRPSMGRGIAAIDIDEGTAAVVGYRLWQRAFASDPAIVGRAIAVSGRTYIVVGVAPERFEGLDLGRSVELWVPLQPPPADPDERQNRSFSIVARLAPGASLTEAQAQLGGMASRLARAYPKSNLGTLAAPTEPRPIIAQWHTRLDPSVRGDVVMIGTIIMVAVGVVLLIGCTNIANLLLSRGTVRGREMAIRLALGASRPRLLRQLFTESVLLGLMGGALGLLFSLWTSDVLPAFLPAEQARLLETGVDGRVIAFTIGVSLAGSLLFGFAPAWQGTAPPVSTILRGDTGRLSDGPRGTTRLRRILVAGQVALAVVLLVSAALLVQSLSNALRADPGFGTRRAVLATVEPPSSEFSAPQRAAYFAAVVDRILRVSGVQAVSLVRTLPLTISSRRGFWPEGYQHQAGEDRELRFNIVEDGYFDVMQIPLLAGRRFDSRDRPSTTLVVMVNREFAARYFGGKPIGRHVTDSSRREFEIVGVVKADARIAVDDRPGPVVYYPLSQSDPGQMSVVARTAGDPGPIIETIRRELTTLDRGVPVFGMNTLSGHISEALATNRLTAALVSACGGMALLLAVVGVYGVIAYAVVRRRREIGVRIALGARPIHVIQLVVSEGVTVTIVGIVCGLAATAGATRILQSMLYGVSASDATTYLMVPLLLAVVSILAAYTPARRALKVDPMSVLRQE